MTDNNMISITIKLFADLTQFGPAKADEKLPEGSSINTIFEKYNIPKEKKTIIIVNSKPHYNRNSILKDGDIIAIFPPLAGG
ncbi:MAG: MoaD/ThiS family protein [Promethearchaeota archaeon]